MGKAKMNAAPVGTDAASNAAPVDRAASSKAAGAAEGQEVQTLEPHMVVFGLDDSGKAHASWFGAGDAELAIKAAGMMGFSVLPITTNEHRAAASGLAAGRVFASGKGFVPFTKMAAYTALAAFPEAYQPPAPVEPEAEPAPTATHFPLSHGQIDVGGLVLASEAPAEPYYPAIVVEKTADNLFVLSWAGWPAEPQFVRRGVDLALLPPSLASLTPATVENAEEPRPAD